MSAADVRLAQKTVAGPKRMLVVLGALGLAQSLLFTIVLNSDSFVEIWRQMLPHLDPEYAEKVLNALKATFITGFGYYGLLIAAGIALHNLRARGFVALTCAIALLPFATGYLWLVTVPAAIWTLIVLGRPEVKAAFRRP